MYVNIYIPKLDKVYKSKSGYIYDNILTKRRVNDQRRRPPPDADPIPDAHASRLVPPEARPPVRSLHKTLKSSRMTTKQKKQTTTRHDTTKTAPDPTRRHQRHKKTQHRTQKNPSPPRENPKKPY